MKNFISNLMGKLPKLFLPIFAASLGVLTLIVGILVISGGFSNSLLLSIGATSTLGVFFNNILLTGLFGLLAFELFKGNKQKCGIISLLLIADFVLTGFGGGISAFYEAGNYADWGDPASAIAACVFIGLELLALFVGAVCVLIPAFIEKADKGLFNTIAAFAFLAAAIFGFAAFISDAIYWGAEYGEGLNAATAIFGGLLTIGEAVFFAFDFFHLSSEGSSEDSAAE